MDWFVNPPPRLLAYEGNATVRKTGSWFDEWVSEWVRDWLINQLINSISERVNLWLTEIKKIAEKLNGF